MYVTPDSPEDHLLRILGVNKIKRQILKEATEQQLTTGEYDQVNLHIDINQLLKPLHDERINKDMTDRDDRVLIASSILNLCAHLRAFLTSSRVGSRILMYYSDSGPYKKFKKSGFEHVDHSIKKGLELVELISIYCNNIHFINCGDIDPTRCVEYYKEVFNTNSSLNMLFTKNDFWLTLLDKSTVLLRPKRDDSYVITHESVFFDLLYKTKYTPECLLDVGLLPAVFAYTGVDCLGVKGVRGIGLSKAIQQFDKAVKKRQLMNQWYSRAELITDDMRVSKPKEFVENYDKVNVLHSYISKAQNIKLQDALVNKFARDELAALNVKYFTGDYSLMLRELTGVYSPKAIVW